MNRRGFLTSAAAMAVVPFPIVTPLPPPTPLPYGPVQPGQFLQQLTIGVNVTLSGDYAQYGQQVVAGVQAAVDETNRFTAPISHVWGWRSYDDRNDTAQAAANASVAAADSTVVGIVGNLTAAMTIAALPRYANVGFAVVVPTVTADVITRRGFFNIFRLPANDSSAGQLFASTVLASRKSVPTIAVALDGDYGYDVARGYVQQAKSDHHPADVLLFPKGTIDPAAAARTVLDKSPAYVFLCGKTAELGPVAEAMRLAGYTGEFGASDGFWTQQTIERYAKTMDGAYVASPMPPLDKIPTIIQLLKDFQNEVGQITPFSAFGYAAAQLIIAAAQISNANTRTTLLQSLQHGGTFTTLVGQFRFNINGDPQIPDIYLYTVSAGGFKFARPAILNGYVL